MTVDRACTLPPWVENPYRLVSLGEITKVVEPHIIVDLAAQLKALELTAGRAGNEPVDRDGLMTCLYHVIAVKPQCIAFGFNTSLAAVERLEHWITFALDPVLLTPLPWPLVKQSASEIAHAFSAEMRQTTFLALDVGMVRYYQEPATFGSSVSGKFPSLLYDIEEAGKCLALRRNTATVFHLMRIMEAGLRALGHSLNDSTLDPATNPSWDRILNRCVKEMEKPLAQRSAEWQVDEAFYSGATARLIGVKDAWRNPTMHVGRKYTEEEALDAWNHVKAFMAHLAGKLSE